MEHSEIVYAIGWSMVATGALIVILASLTSRHGYTATTIGLIFALSGLLIAGHLWAAGVVLGSTLARYGYYLYFQKGGSHGEKEHDG